MTKRSRYKPKYKIGDKVISLSNGDIGIIKQINNICNIRDNKRTVPEYYVKWSSGAWTRYDTYYFDEDGGYHSPPIVSVIPLTPTAKLLYDKK